MQNRFLFGLAALVSWGAAWAADFKVGDKVEVLWSGIWYRAEVKATPGSGQWKIGYDGYASNWDEVVGPERIRARGATAPSAAATTPAASATSRPPASAAKPAAAANAEQTFPWPERPAGAQAGIEGAFLRVQSWFFNGRVSLDNEGWFFTKNGRVARSPRGGFDLQGFSVAPAARKSDGVYWIEGDKLFVRWASKEKVEQKKFQRKGKDLEIDGLFASRVDGFKKGWRADVTFEGAGAVSGGGVAVSASNTLVLRRDGTFGRTALASASMSTSGGSLGASSSGASEGTYEFDGHTLTLRHSDGRIVRSTVFAFSDKDAQGAPEYLWRDGAMLNRPGVEKR